MTTENKNQMYQRNFNLSIKDIKIGMRLEGVDLSSKYLTLTFGDQEGVLKNISLRLSEIYHMDIIHLINTFKYKPIYKIKILETGLIVNGEIFLESYALLNK